VRILIITLSKLDFLRDFSNKFIDFTMDEVIIHKAMSNPSLFSDLKKIILNSYIADYTLTAVINLKYYTSFTNLSVNAKSTVILKLFRQN